jgi:hypothetical protein
MDTKQRVTARASIESNKITTAMARDFLDFAAATQARLKDVNQALSTNPMHAIPPGSVGCLSTTLI